MSHHNNNYLFHCPGHNLTLIMATEPESVRIFVNSVGATEEACKNLCIDLIKAGQVGHVKTLLEKMEALRIEIDTFRSDFGSAINAIGGGGYGHSQPPKANTRTIKGASKEEAAPSKRVKSPQKAEAEA
jgi:hypothetical protein